jgi:hypothetical protein
MKLLIVLAMIFGGYYYFLTHSTNLVLGQVQQLQEQYTYVANHADQIAAGQ